MNYTVGSICAEIDVEKTKIMYRRMPAERAKNSAEVNFQKNTLMRRQNLEEYLQPLGIDVLKYQGLSVVSINQPMQSVTYCGYYPINTDNESELREILCAEDSKNESSVNKEDFGFEFNFEYINNQVVLYFWVDLPWLLMPPIPKSRYANKAALPLVCTE